MFFTRSSSQLVYPFLKGWFLSFGVIMACGLMTSFVWGNPESQISSKKSTGKEPQPLKKGDQVASSSASFCQLKANSKQARNPRSEMPRRNPSFKHAQKAS